MQQQKMKKKKTKENKTFLWLDRDRFIHYEKSEIVIHTTNTRYYSFHSRAMPEPGLSDIRVN